MENKEFNAVSLAAIFAIGDTLNDILYVLKKEPSDSEDKRFEHRVSRYFEIIDANLSLFASVHQECQSKQISQTEKLQEHAPSSSPLTCDLLLIPEQESALDKP